MKLCGKLPEWSVKNAAYYMNVADMISKDRKRCYSRTVGAVLVKDDSIIVTGFNGPPRGIETCDNWLGNWEDRVDWHSFVLKKNKCPRKTFNFKSGEGLEYCPASHAEQNCICLAAKLGISTNDSVMYVTSISPCKNCVISLIQSGIKGIFCEKFETPYDLLGIKLLEELSIPLIMVERTTKFINNLEQFILKGQKDDSK